MEEVVSELEGLLQHVSGLGEALALYNEYLGLFDADPDDLGTLMAAEKEANSRYQVCEACDGRGALQCYAVSQQAHRNMPVPPSSS